MLLEEKELLKPPYHIQNQAYRHAILRELYRLQAIELRPQNLWEYKASNNLHITIGRGGHVGRGDLSQGTTVSSNNAWQTCSFLLSSGSQFGEVSVPAVRHEALPTLDALLLVLV